MLIDSEIYQQSKSGGLGMTVYSSTSFTRDLTGIWVIRCSPCFASSRSKHSASYLS